MKKFIKDIIDWIKVLWFCFWYSGLWLVALVIWFAYLISTSNLPDWFKFWLLK